MRALPVSLGVGAMIMVVGVALSSARPEAASTLRLASDFSTIGDDKERAIALFNEAGKVILNPRCVNCHPAGDRPRQGDDGHPHQPLVVRGMGGFGAIGMHCTSCHGPENFDPGRVPGHPAWHLAPIEMAWADKSLGEICEQIKDPKRNGGKTWTRSFTTWPRIRSLVGAGIREWAARPFLARSRNLVPSSRPG